MTPFYRTIILLLSCVFFFSCSQTSTDSLDIPDISGSYEMNLIIEPDTSYTLPTHVKEMDSESSFLIFRGGWLILTKDGGYEMLSDRQTRFFKNGNKTTLARLNYGTFTNDQDSIYLQPDPRYSEVYKPVSGSLETIIGDDQITIAPYSKDVKFIFEEMKTRGKSLAHSKKDIPFYELSNKEDFLFIPEITNENTLIQIMGE